MAILIGVDVGQKVDPTAIAVAELTYRPVDPSQQRSKREETHFLIRSLTRLPLGTSYPDVAKRIGEIWWELKNRSSENPRVWIDATGVGQPVVDFVRTYVGTPRRVWPVIFNHGDHRKENEEERKVILGKAYLVSRLQVLLQSDRIHFPDGPEFRQLAKELLDYEIRIDEDSNDRYGAFKVGTHDDLVTAVGLAVQIDPKRSAYPI